MNLIMMDNNSNRIMFFNQKQNLICHGKIINYNNNNNNHNNNNNKDKDKISNKIKIIIIILMNIK